MIQLKYIGCHFIESQNFMIHRPNGSNDYLLLLFHTEVYMWLNDEKKLLKPGALILFTPSTANHYHNPYKGFDNDWFHFNADDFTHFINDLNIPLNTPFYVNDSPWVHKQIQLIEREYILKDIGYTTQIHNLISSFFIQLSRKYNSYDSHGHNPHYMALETVFREIRSTILTQLSKSWQVEDMAKMANLSKSRFTYLYKSFFRISPKEDLLSERFNMARHLLKSTTLNIAQISQKVGYENIYHFCKQFKKITSFSPTAYRKHHKN